MTEPTLTEPQKAELHQDQSHWKQDKDARLVPYGDTNLGTPLELVDGCTVPTELFFVRSNYTVPTVDVEAWRLTVHGLVEHELELSYTDLIAMPQRTVTAFLECAGDGRTHFDPPVDGTPWRDDAVGCATWTGVPLARVLDLAGVDPAAVEIVSQGGDDPAMRRGLPLRAALNPDTLLAWQMNGEPLLPAHGKPVRLLVPGWAGIASTKWIIGLELVDKPFDGYWNSEKYVVVSPTGELLGPVGPMPVKSVVVSPSAGASVDAGVVRVRGYAWSGCEPVSQVEVSVDGGLTFAPAKLAQKAGARAWVAWTYDYRAGPGPACVRSRATDAAGRAQPDQPVWNAQGYQMNAVSEARFEVREPA